MSAFEKIYIYRSITVKRYTKLKALVCPISSYYLLMFSRFKGSHQELSKERI